MGSESTITMRDTSILLKQKMLNDYKYATGTAKQAGDYNKITTYLILLIRKTYKNGSDIADAIENQDSFNFNCSAPKLKILTTVKTVDTFPEEKLEIKHENDQYKMMYEGGNYNFISSKNVIIPQPGESICIPILANAQQDYSIG